MYFANKRSSTRFRQLWNSMVYIMNNDFATTFNDFYLDLYTNPFEPENKSSRLFWLFVRRT